jgi:hypothetical protein
VQIGLYPIYELGVADLLTRTLDELHVQSIRRLFSDRVYEPELQLQRAPVKKPSRPVITRTREEVLGEVSHFYKTICSSIAVLCVNLV